MNSENNHISVFIVASSAIGRAGLEAVLQTDERLIVAGGAAEISVVPSDFSFGRIIDVLLVNVEREREFNALTEFLNSGEEASDAHFPAVVVFLATNFQNSEQVSGLLRNGARGILSNEADADEISAAVFAAANNLIVAAPEILETLFPIVTTESFLPVAEKDLSGEMIENLTAREREVLEFLVEGESNKAIASHLNISEHTVKFHVASLFGKLAVNTRTEAVTIALRRGLILL